MTMQPPQGNYPTSPPWASPAATTAAVAVETAPEAPYTQHGQLLVAHPELMQSADRPKPPSVLPTGLFTLVFGPFGAISAARRADTAARGRNPRTPYWITFGLVMAFNLVVWMALVAVAVPAYLTVREQAITKQVQENIVASPPFRDDKVRATAAACAPTGERGSDGLRTYRCTVTLSNKKSITIDVQADAQGNGQQVE